VPGAAGEQVVRQVVGDHARVRAGEDEVLLDGQQELPPGPSACLGRDLERSDAQRGPAACVLREFLFSGGQSLADQAAALQPDADEQERDREGVGQVLEVVGDVAAVAAAGVKEVDIIDHAEPDVAGEDRVSGLMAEFLGVAPVVAGQAEEPAEHRVERPLARRRGQAHVDHGYPVVPGAGDRAVEADLPLVEFPGEDLGDGRLAQPGVGVDHRGALDLVPVLAVRFDDVVQVLVDGAHLRGAQRPEVCVPDRPLLLVLRSRLPGQPADLRSGQLVGPLPRRGGDELLPARAGGQRVGALGGPQRRAHTVSIASA